MAYPIENIIAIVRGQLQNQYVYPAHIQHLLYDSRLLNAPSQTLFFALESSRNDGHKYIPELYEQGVRSFVVGQKIPINDYPKANFIEVEDARQALHKLAKFHREQFHLPTIGITGSNGKTIVKEWLYQLFQDDYAIVRSPKSYNSQIGVPISVWQIEARHQLAIFEAGISKTGEMERIAPIIQCNIGIFTNIGDAHNEGFEHLKQKAAEKAILFNEAETIIYCKDHHIVHNVLSSAEAFNEKELINWSKGDNASLSRVKIQKQPKKTRITADYHHHKIVFSIPFTDDASIENAIHCWLCGAKLGIDLDVLAHRFLSLAPVALRLELLQAVNNCTIINDSYSADLASLNIALNFLAQQDTHTKRTVILSDFLQNDGSERFYRSVAQLLIQKNIQRLIAIGHSIRAIQTYLRDIDVTYFATTDAFLQRFQHNDFNDETILIKGAREFHFEKIANRLARKAHRTTLEINLNAIVHNLNVYRNLLLPTTKIMAMVKASAYGSGSSEVAKVLEFNRIDYLAVAYADEGVELRNDGVELPILVLNPELASFDSIIRYRLEPEIYSFSLLQSFDDYLSNFSLPQSYPIHIKVNTGMNRLGFELEEAEQLRRKLSQYPRLKIQSIFSHLAGSDGAQFDGFTYAQMERYQYFYNTVTQDLPYAPIRHILNTGGITRFGAYQMDMVRLGIGLYGIDSQADIQQQLQTVSTLKATISQIKQLAPNETVGYNRSGKASRPTRSATISIGYADGLMRAASNGRAAVWVRGVLAPIIGNVCMDMTMIDVTNVPTAQEGDEVIVFGAQHDIKILAQQLNTIPYEIFTSISNRVKRVYFQE